VHSTWAEIDLDHLGGNFRGIKGKIGPGVKTLVAVKANAYGHGAIVVSRRLLAEGADMLGVAAVSEVAELREAGITAPVLLLGCTLPEAVGPALDQDARLTVCDAECAAHVAAAAGARNREAVVHVKVDTGMGRIGVRWDRAPDLIRRLTRMERLRIEGVFTHFASADEADKGFTYRQIERFREVIEALEKDGLHIPLRHAANSSALLDVPESYLNMVRPGLILYGLHPGAEVSQSIPIKPVLSLKTRITFVKEIEPGETVSYNRRFTARRRSRVATVPIGYGDGLDRHLSNRGQALVGGRRAPIIGTICMDQTVIDVTDVPPPSVGDEVVVYGAQGGERISVEEVARLLDTIPYEITCAIGRRVPRVVVGGNRATT
jgi:alanine racemase